MALSDDQRAMLQLLLQREQSYADIASLLGLDVEQVRARARTALTEIGGEDPDREVSLTDYLLGQADPIGRADVARQLQSDGGARDLAVRLQTQLRVLAPGADFPELPAASGRAAGRAEPPPVPEPASPKPAGTNGARPPGGFASTLNKRQRQAIAGLLGGGILVAIIVLIATGVFGGEDDDPAPSGSDGSSRQASSNDADLTSAQLTAQDGSDAQGVAVFAQIRNTPVLNINVANLSPTPEGQSYVIWLYGGPSRAFPLVRQRVGTDGELRGATPIPTQLIQALQQGLFDSIDVSLASNSEVTATLRRARRSQQLPPYAGRSVVRGRITGPGFSTSEAGSGSSGSGQ